MSSDIRALPLDDASVMAQVVAIARSAGFDFADEKLISNLRDSSPDSTCLGAFIDDELVAVNAFMAHSILVDGARGTAYQSGWSATLPAQQGKGLFRSIINAAKDLLRGRGGTYIVGFPNAVSEPIFVKKLGFLRTPMRRVVIPTFPRLAAALSLDSQRYFDALAAPDVIRFDQFQNAAWKRREHADLVSVEDYTNMIWGKVATRRLPVLGKRNVLLVGGCEFNKPQLIPQLLARLRRESGVDLVRFVAAEGSMIASAARLPLSGDRTEPFIHFPLQDRPGPVRFDAHVGLKDAY